VIRTAMTNALVKPVDRTAVEESADSAAWVSYAAPVGSACRTVSANRYAMVASAVPTVAEVPVESVRVDLPAQNTAHAVPLNALDSHAETMAVAGSVARVLRAWLVTTDSAPEATCAPRSVTVNSAVRMVAEVSVVDARLEPLAWKGFATNKRLQPMFRAVIPGAVQQPLRALHPEYFGFSHSDFLSPC